MNTLVTLATILAVAAVAVILGMGIWNMLKGGDGNLSQKLMRARVIAQAIAIAVLMGALFFFGRCGNPT